MAATTSSVVVAPGGTATAPAAAPLRLLGINSEQRLPPDAPAIPDRWAGAPVLAEETQDLPDQHLRLRVRLVRDETFKYPLLRLEEVLRLDPAGGGATLVSQLGMVADHLIVKPAPGVEEPAFLGAITAAGGSIRARKPASGTWLVAFPATGLNDLPAALDDLRAVPGLLRVAEPDHVVHLALTPNDPSYTQLYGLHNTGQTGGTPDADIDAPEAWEITTGSRSILVGVIDTGIDHTHPDLAANMWTNPGEIAGNGVDDDGNGYVDDIRGWDFVNDDANPMDDHYHGTHCAGTIGAVGGNATGVVGVAHQVSLVGLKFLSSSGSGATSDAIEAVAYATRIGCHLTSNSWGGGAFSQALSDVIAEAGAAGRLFVAAAGNSSRDTDVLPNYPSGYELDNIVSVAATDHADALASFSNYGATTVDLGAPGVGILSTSPGNGYRTLSGTSMATPHVAGAAAVVLARMPDLTATTLKALLLTTGDPIPSLAGKTVSAARLNLHSALQGSSGLLLSPALGWTASGPLGGPFPDTETTFRLTNLDSSAHGWSATVDVPWATLGLAFGTVPAGASGTFVVQLDAEAARRLPAGNHTGTVTITDLANNRQQTRTLRLVVVPPPILSFNLDTDPGWARTGQWTYGQPAGKGGDSYGYPDPISGHTGDRVLGINLQGNYSPEAGAPQTLTAGPFDLTGYVATRLQFRRWLNTDYAGWVSNRVEISTDGSTWQVLWKNGNVFTNDRAWSLQDHDISQQADGRATVYFRWVHQVVAASGALPLSGWNIDDVAILGALPRSVAFLPLPPVPENVGTVAATLRLQPAPVTPVTIRFTSSAPALVPAPAEITLPAGATTAPVMLTVLDNALLDGTRTARIAAITDGYAATPLNLAVDDDETATLSLQVPATATEGGLAAAGTVFVSRAPGAPVVVRLATDSPDVGTPPAFVTIPAGATSAPFAITFPDNTRIEGTRPVTITATVGGWTSGSAVVAVADNDPRTLSVALAGGLGEGRGLLAQGGTVTLPGYLAAPLVVTLASSDSTQLAVPATVTIPAGASSAKFDLTQPDDDELDGVRAITVTAAADTFTTGTGTASVADNDPASFVFGTVTSPQYLGQAFAARITALDVDGAPAAGFSGTAALSGALAGAPAAMLPARTGAFVDGVWTGAITCQVPGENWTLRADLAEARGTSNTFTVRTPAVQTVALANNDIVYDPGTDRIYASTPSGTLVPVDPETGALGTPVAVAATPTTLLARAGDGSRLWVVFDGNMQAVPVTLPQLSVGSAFSFGPGVFGLTQARDIVTLPEAPERLVVARNRPSSTTLQDVSVYERGVRVAGTAEFSTYAYSIEAGSGAGRVFGYDNQSSAFKFYRIQVDAGGIRKLDESSLLEGYNVTLHADGNLVAATSGRVFDGESRRILATLPYSGLVRPDAALGRVFVLSNPSGGSSRLRAYDTERFTEVGATDVSGVSGTPAQLIRVGADRLAFRTPTQIFLLNTTLVPTADSANLRVTQVATPDPAVAGQPLGYLVSVRNLGGGAAESVVLANTFPAGAAPGGIVVSQGSATLSATQITADFGVLAAGAEATLRFTITPTAAGNASNTVQVSSVTGDPDTSNNQSTLGVSVSTAPALSLRRAALGARDVAYDFADDRLLVSIGNTASAFANSLLQLDPATFAPLAARYVGDNPGRINLTANAEYAYTILDGSFGISRTAVGATLGESTSFPADQINGSSGLQRAGDIATIPGRPTAVAARLKSVVATGGHGVGLYENGQLLPKIYGDAYTSGSLIASADGSKLYGYESNFTRIAVQADGVTLLGNVSAPSFSSTQRYKRLGDRLFTTGGKVFDPETLGLVADLVYSGPIEPSLDDDRIYLLAGSTLRAFHLQTFTPVGTLSLGTLQGTPTHLVRAGGRSLAFVTDAGLLYLLDTPALVPPPPLRVILPARLTEGVGTVPGVGRVEILRPAEADIPVTLGTSATNVLDVTRQLVIPAGQTFATFDITVTDNAGLNGTRAVTVSAATSATYTPKPATVQVDDDESATLALELPSALTEGAGALPDGATLRLSGPALAPVAVTLASSDTTELQAPATVTIPAGADSVTFTLTVPDDDLLDGTQAATLTASVPGYASATASTQVTDNESRVLALALPATGAEGGSVYATLTLPGKTLTPLVVSFTSSDLTELAQPSSVTIAAGQASASFYCSLPDDSLRDGAQSVTLTASATGFTPASATLSVRDNDPATGAWFGIPVSRNAGSSFAVMLAFYAIDGQLAEGFYGNVAVSATNAAGPAALQNAPVTLYASNGVVSSSLAVRTAGTGTRLLAQLPGIDPIQSDPFTVLPTAATSFAFLPFASPQVTGMPVNIGITAMDTYGNVATGFTGTASLDVSPGVFEVGTRSGSSATLFAIYAKSRGQVLYPASALGGAKRIGGLSLNLTASPAQTYSRWTIRLKPSSASTTSAWEPTGWTVVHQSDAAINSSGWVYFPFSTPYAYDGGSELLVDFSFNNQGIGAWGYVEATSAFNRMIFGYSSGSSDDPLAWTGSTPTPNASQTVPNLRLTLAATGGAVSPTATGAFVAGVWTGPLTFTQPGAGIALRATSGSIVGQSAPFEINLAPPVLVPEPAITGGSTNTLVWTPPAFLAGNQVTEAQASATESFTSPLAAPWTTATEHTFGPLAEGPWRFRARTRLNVPRTGSWSQTSQADFAGGTFTSTSATIVPGSVTLAVSGASYPPAGTYVSSSVQPANRLSWGRLTHSAHRPAGTSLTVDVLDGAGTLLAANVASGTDLSTLPAVATQSTLRLRANLATTQSSFTPGLQDWTVEWFTTVSDTFDSDWSPVVTSIQDATEPALAVTSPTAVSSYAYTLTGTSADANGVQALTVNGQPAATADAFGQWSRLLTLEPGPNVLSLLVRDLASPANTRSVSFTVTYTPVLDADGDGLPDAWETRHGLDPASADARHGARGDLDGDGIGNLLEYAFGLDPTRADAEPPCAVTSELNSADGRRYLHFRYRRLREPGALGYRVVTSADLVAWSAPATSPEVLSVTPDAGGETETVVVRLRPALGGGPVFVRLQVEAP